MISIRTKIASSNVCTKRDEDFHARGPGLSAKSDEIKFDPTGYSDKSGTFQSSGAPNALIGQDVRGSTSKQTYFLD
jgi:hypothetical protein